MALRGLLGASAVHLCLGSGSGPCKWPQEPASHLRGNQPVRSLLSLSICICSSVRRPHSYKVPWGTGFHPPAETSPSEVHVAPSNQLSLQRALNTDGLRKAASQNWFLKTSYHNVNKTFLNGKCIKILKQRFKLFSSYSDYMFAEWLEGDFYSLQRKQEGVTVADHEMLPVARTMRGK